MAVSASSRLFGSQLAACSDVAVIRADCHGVEPESGGARVDVQVLAGKAAVPQLTFSSCPPSSAWKCFPVLQGCIWYPGRICYEDWTVKPGQ